MAAVDTHRGQRCALSSGERDRANGKIAPLAAASRSALAHSAWLSPIADFNLSHSSRSKPYRRISHSLGGIRRHQRRCLYLAGRRIGPYMAPGTFKHDETAVDDTCLRHLESLVVIYCRRSLQTSLICIQTSVSEDQGTHPACYSIRIRPYMRRNYAAHFVGYTFTKTGLAYTPRASAIFSSPFLCLACRNEQGDKRQNVMIDGCSAWNAHVSLEHSEIARNWSVGESSEGKREPMCFLCGHSFSCRSTFSTLQGDACQRKEHLASHSHALNAVGVRATC
jgi:hypothetical protein